MFELIKLRWQKFKLNHRFLPLIEKAKAAKDKNQWQELGQEYSNELEIIELAKRYATQRRLMRKADRYLLPLPSRNNKSLWQDDDAFWDLLTPQAFADLKNIVRTEEKERWDLHTRWVYLLVGLIGALTGFFAIILN